jgi:hypothetical protein
MCTTGKPSASPKEASATGRPDRDPLATQDDPANFLTQDSRTTGDGSAPLGTKEQLVATLEQVRGDAQDMLAFGGAVKQEFLDGRAVLQDQIHLRALAVDFFISLLTTVDGWAERTLAEIQGWEDLSPDGKRDRGLELFARLPVATPTEHTDRTPVPPRTQRRRRPPGSASTT